jgi:hypothetical protein
MRGKRRHETRLPSLLGLSETPLRSTHPKDAYQNAEVIEAEKLHAERVGILMRAKYNETPFLDVFL